MYKDLYIMTRLERQKQKIEKEKKLLKSLLDKLLTSKEKSLFRSTSIWQNFRKECNEYSNGLDVITLRKLPKRWENHHLDLSPKNYCKLIKKNFAPLSNKSHDTLHYLYEYYRKDKDVLKRLKKYLDLMVKINNGKNINDYKKEEKNK